MFSSPSANIVQIRSLEVSKRDIKEMQAQIRSNCKIKNVLFK